MFRLNRDEVCILDGQKEEVIMVKGKVKKYSFEEARKQVQVFEADKEDKENQKVIRELIQLSSKFVTQGMISIRKASKLRSILNVGEQIVVRYQHDNQICHVSANGQVYGLFKWIKKHPELEADKVLIAEYYKEKQLLQLKLLE